MTADTSLRSGGWHWPAGLPLGLIAALLLSLLLALWALSPAAAAPPAAVVPETAVATAVAYTPLFGSREVKATTMTAFKQWLSVMNRYSGERSLEQLPCTNDSIICHIVEWKAFIATLDGKDRLSQLEEVNRYMNAHPYIQDIANWGLPDYWETPKEFLDRNGDCEDYAIAKYYSMRALGMGNETLRIVVLQDLNLRIPHAILVAYVDGKPYVLDNQIPQVVTADVIHHYRPFYSINEQNWWLHRPQ